ncbi:hypothetical protein [Rhodopila sp.]|uniref:hypothetical protein n=1 Tax=Rhodopila sp. TaxID=2480087 RepID=UPI003D0C3B07
MARKSYSARTGMDARSSKILANAMFGAKPEFYEDDNGHVVRRWKASEHSSYTNEDLAVALSNRVAVEPGELLDRCPPSCIKYCVTKGFLVPVGTSGQLYFVTHRAAIELGLPNRFKGGANHGRRIPFAPSPTDRKSKT